MTFSTLHLSVGTTTSVRQLVDPLCIFSLKYIDLLPCHPPFVPCTPTLALPLPFPSECKLLVLYRPFRKCFHSSLLHLSNMYTRVRTSILATIFLIPIRIPFTTQMNCRQRSSKCIMDFRSRSMVEATLLGFIQTSHLYPSCLASHFSNTP